MKIKYVVVSEGIHLLCMTKCPHGKPHFVGSIGCDLCPMNKVNDVLTGTVDCLGEVNENAQAS